jgi:hypothetical protein
MLGWSEGCGQEVLTSDTTRTTLMKSGDKNMTNGYGRCVRTVTFLSYGS